MPYERNYSVMEVARRLEHCEGNVNPGVPMGAPAGHAIAQHRDITDAGLQARHGLSTAFMRHPNAGRIGPLPLGRHQRAYMDLAFALCSVLNIPDVQQLGLRYLDPNPLAPGVIPPKRLVVHCDGQAGGVNVQVSPDGNTVTLDHVRRVQWAGGRIPQRRIAAGSIGLAPRAINAVIIVVDRDPTNLNTPWIQTAYPG